MSIERLPLSIVWLVEGLLRGAPVYCCNNVLGIRGEGMKAGIKM